MIAENQHILQSTTCIVISRAVIKPLNLAVQLSRDMVCIERMFGFREGENYTSVKCGDQISSIRGFVSLGGRVGTISYKDLLSTF